MPRWTTTTLRALTPLAFALAWTAPASGQPEAWPEDPPTPPAATAAPTAAAPPAAPTAAAPPPATTAAPPAAPPAAAPAHTAPPPPLAPPHPPPEDRWWEDVRRPQSGTSRIPFIATGGALAGVGAMLLMAAGITWLVAAGNAASLDDECPNDLCYEDSRGGRSLERARDAETAADVMVAIAMPSIGTGVILLLVGGGLRDSAPRVGAAPMVIRGGSGLMLEATF